MRVMRGVMGVTGRVIQVTEGSDRSSKRDDRIVQSFHNFYSCLYLHIAITRMI